MFWDSVQQGLSVLLHWQTYVAMIEFLALMILPQLATGAAITISGCVAFEIVVFDNKICRQEKKPLQEQGLSKLKSTIHNM